MKHADRLTGGSCSWTGLPNLQDLGKLLIGENVREESSTATSSSSAALPGPQAGDRQRESVGDYVARELLEAILKCEEEHIDFLETQLGSDRARRHRRTTSSRRWARTEH